MEKDSGYCLDHIQSVDSKSHFISKTAYFLHLFPLKQIKNKHSISTIDHHRAFNQHDCTKLTLVHSVNTFRRSSGLQNAPTLVHMIYYSEEVRLANVNCWMFVKIIKGFDRILMIYLYFYTNTINSFKTTGLQYVLHT